MTLTPGKLRGLREHITSQSGSSLRCVVVWHLSRRIGGLAHHAVCLGWRIQPCSILPEIFNVNIRFSRVEGSEGRNHPGYEA